MTYQNIPHLIILTEKARILCAYQETDRKPKFLTLIFISINSVKRDPKLNELARIAQHLNDEQVTDILSSFFYSHFNH